MTKRKGGDGYSDVGLPRRWEGALEFDWTSIAREALTSIMPEMEIGTSAKYLAKARFALFLARAVDAIKKGRLGSHRRQISNLLCGRGEPLGTDLEAAKDRAMRGSMKRDVLNKKVQRVKLAYALGEAQKSLAQAQ